MALRLSDPEVMRRAAEVKVLILDVDGVLTDGRIILDNAGNEYKAFHVRDGHGIKLATRESIVVALITGRSSEVVKRRAGELGITEVYQNSKRKILDYDKLVEKLGVSDHEVAYVGDDIVDLPVMARVGLPVAVADADPEVLARALAVTQNRAGRGAVREVTDTLLKARGAWDEIIKKYTEV